MWRAHFLWAVWLSSVWVTFQLAVSCAAWFSWVSLITGYTSGLRGMSPQALTFLGGVRFITWRLKCPKKGNADGAWGIFGTAGCVWDSALWPDPPKKRSCATLVRWWGIWLNIFYRRNKVFFFLSLVVNRIKNILINFLSDLKKSCKFFRSRIYINDFRRLEINLLS